MSASTERQAILQMVADGSIRPDEAARLLSAISEVNEAQGGAASSTTSGHASTSDKAEPERKSAPVVDIVRPDGSHYAMQVPDSLAPAIVKIVGVYMKESARTASRETLQGFKALLANKTDELKAAVKGKMGGSGIENSAASAAEAVEAKRRAARRRILDMIQNGRLTADWAERLLDEVDLMFVAELQKVSAG